jgi:hypothetical protein
VEEVGELGFEHRSISASPFSSWIINMGDLGKGRLS